MGKILFLLFMTVLPCVLGAPLIREEEREPYGLLFSWCLGWAVLYGLFFVPALICGLLHTSLTFLFVLYMGILLCAAVFSIYKNAPALTHLRSIPARFKTWLCGLTFPEVAAAVLVIAHAAVTFLYMHIDDDDFAYVATATTSLDTNTLMVYNGASGKLLRYYSMNSQMKLTAAPQYAFFACLSKLSGIRPAPLCHTFLPPVFTVLFFSVLFMIGYRLFRGDRRKAGLFVVFAFTAAAFSYFSTYTAGTFMLIRSWQGKAQVVGFVLPMVVYTYLTIFLREDQGCAVKESRSDWFLLLLVLSAGCLQTVMGGMLAAVMTMGFALVSSLILRKKRVFLYSLAAVTIPFMQLMVYFAILKKWIRP